MSDQKIQVDQAQSQQPKLLSLEEANTMAGAYARLEQLRADTTPELQLVGATPEVGKLTREAEIQALIEFLSQAFLTHAGEFLGNFFALQTEYAPLCRALAPIVRRINATSATAAPIAEQIRQ